MTGIKKSTPAVKKQLKGIYNWKYGLIIEEIVAAADGLDETQKVLSKWSPEAAAKLDKIVNALYKLSDDEMKRLKKP